MLRLFMAAFAAVFFVGAAQAQECVTVEMVVNLVEQNGGKLLSLTDVDGVGFDQVLLVDNGKQALVSALVRDTCIVGQFLPLAPIQRTEKA